MSDSSAVGDRQVVVGLVADPGLPTEIAQRLCRTLPYVLSDRVSDKVAWDVRATSEELTLDADDRIPLETKAREKVPAEGWDFVVCLTDLPRMDGARPIAADVNLAASAALVSLPAIGWMRLRANMQDTIVHLVGVMAGGTLKREEVSVNGRHRVRRRPTEKVSPVRQLPSPDKNIDVHLILTGVRGRVRLLFGMLRDNRPWRLVPSLSRAIAAAIAIASFGIFYPIIWNMADSLSLLRLVTINVFAVAMMVAWLVLFNRLWERPHMREKVVLYNVSTMVTVVIGVVCMYVVLYVVTLLGAVAVISTSYLQSQLGHPVGAVDYITLVWLSSSLGTVAGALGSSLEAKEAVHRATYSRREQERRNRARRREQERRADER